MIHIKRLLRIVILSLTVTTAPVAILVSVNSALLAGQAGSALSAGASGVHGASQLGDDADIAAQYALWWHEQHGDVDTPNGSGLKTAFEMLTQTPEYRTAAMAAAQRVGDAWDSGQDGVWTVDFSPAIRVAETDLDPAVAEYLYEHPQLQSEPWLNPGAHKLTTISIVAALIAVGLCAATVLSSTPVRMLGRYLWPLAPFSALLLWMLSAAANSQDPVGAALGGWLQDRLQLATIATLVVGIATALIALRFRVHGAA